MICENCGTENPNNARFCRKCGKTFVIVDGDNVGVVKKDKNMILAVIISFFLAGLGIAYAGNTKKGVLIFTIFALLVISGIISPFSLFIYNTYLSLLYLRSSFATSPL